MRWDEEMLVDLHTIDLEAAGRLSIVSTYKLTLDTWIVSGWNTFPGEWGFHGRVDVKVGSEAEVCLVLEAKRGYAHILVGDKMLWIDSSSIRPC